MLIINLILLLLQSESCFFDISSLICLWRRSRRLADFPNIFEEAILPDELDVETVFEQLEIYCGLFNSNFLAVLVSQVVFVNDFQQSAPDAKSLVRRKNNELRNAYLVRPSRRRVVKAILTVWLWSCRCISLGPRVCELVVRILAIFMLFSRVFINSSISYQLVL